MLYCIVLLDIEVLFRLEFGDGALNVKNINVILFF